MPGFSDIMGMVGGASGGAGGGPWSTVAKGVGTAMETTGRGFASLNPKISGALSGAAAGEHSAYQRMSHQAYQQQMIDSAHNSLGNDIQRGKALMGPGAVSIHPDAQL